MLLVFNSDLIEMQAHNIFVCQVALYSFIGRVLVACSNQSCHSSDLFSDELLHIDAVHSEQIYANKFDPLIKFILDPYERSAFLCVPFTKLTKLRYRDRSSSRSSFCLK